MATMKRPRPGADTRAQRWLAPVAPRLSHDGEAITYDRGATLAKGGEGQPGPGTALLDAFLRLRPAAREGGDAVVEFAQEWGVLGLCSHGYPATACEHPQPAYLVGDDGVTSTNVMAGAPVGTCNPSARESLSGWAEWVQRASDVVRVADAEKLGQQPPADAVRRLAAYGSRGWADESGPLGPGAGRGAVAAATTRWLRDCDAGLVLAWQATYRAPSVQVGAVVPDAGVLAALAYEVAVTASADATGSARLWTCDECGGLFSPKRRPNTGVDPRTGQARRVYCPACREANAPQRAADARRRQTKEA